MNERRFLIMIEELGDCGERNWHKFADLTFHCEQQLKGDLKTTLDTIREGLAWSGKTYAIAEVNSDSYKYRDYLEEIKSYTEDNLTYEDLESMIYQACNEALGETSQ